MSKEETQPKQSGEVFDGLVRSPNHFSPEEYRRILARTAAIPGIDAALAEGEVAYRAFLESVKKGELRSSPGTAGSADGERGV